MPVRGLLEGVANAEDGGLGPRAAGDLQSDGEPRWAVKPQGTVRTGWPVRLNGKVQRMVPKTSSSSKPSGE